MSWLDVLLIFFFVVTLLNYWLRRSVLYPPFVFCAMWLVDLIVIRSGVIETDPVHAVTLTIVGAGAASFSAGGLVAGLVPRSLLHIHLFASERENPPNLIHNILVIALLCGLPILFYQILQVSGVREGAINMIMQARQAELDAIENGQPIRSLTLDYFMPFAICTSLALATETKNWRFWVVTSVACLACVLSTGRTYLLLLIAGQCAIKLIVARQESFLRALRLIRWPMILFLMLYIGLIFTNKDLTDMSGGPVGIATYLFVSYIVGPLVAFDRVVQHPEDFAVVGSHTFDFPMKLAGMLHLADYVAPPRVGSFVWVPFPTNVYTVFKFSFLELGISGTLILLFMIGILHSVLYLKAREGGRFSIYLFAFSFYSVLIVIFDDAYYSTGAYLRAIVFGLLYFSAGTVPLRLFPKTRNAKALHTNKKLQPVARPHVSDRGARG